MHRHALKWLWLCALIMIGSGCNHLGGGAAHPVPSMGPAIGPAAREYLASSEQEEEGYGFYSYLLLPKPPKPATIERYRAAFDAFLRIIPKEQQRLEAARLNLTYALVTDAPPESVQAVMAGALPDDPRRKAAIDWLIEHHDYARSTEILRRFRKAGESGPLIVQAPKPIASLSDVKAALVQDLSEFDPKLIGEIVDHVFAESDDKQSWSDDELATYLIVVRNFWERLGVNATRVTALVSWIPIDKLLGS
jgi:hypothetical protein